MKTLQEFLEDIGNTFSRMDCHGGRSGQTQIFVDTHTFKANTTETYSSQTKQFAKWVNEKYGITDHHFLKTKYAEEYISNKVEQFKSGEIGASTVKTAIHALTKYQNGLRDQFHYRARVIDTAKMLYICKQNGVVRKLEDAKKSIKITNVEANQIIKELAGTRSPNTHVMCRVAEFQKETGGRISATLRLQVRDLDFTSNTVKFVGDKGGKTRVVSVSPEYMSKLKEQVNGKKSGRQVFEFHDKNGKLKTIDEARKEMNKVIANVSKKIGLDGANTHSLRKAFSQTRYNNYFTMSYSQLEKRLIERMNEDKSGQTRKRINAVHEHVNRHRLHPKDSNKPIRKPRKFTKEELARLLASIDIGHNRLDVMRFYINRVN